MSMTSPRIPKTFESLTQVMAISSLNRIRDIVDNAEITNPNLMRAITFLADRGFGKAKQTITASTIVDILNAGAAVQPSDK